MASDRAEIEAYIRRAAAARGLDPDFAVRVAKAIIEVFFADWY